jgi:hypothetical protein
MDNTKRVQNRTKFEIQDLHIAQQAAPALMGSTHYQVGLASTEHVLCVKHP